LILFSRSPEKTIIPAHDSMEARNRATPEQLPGLESSKNLIATGFRPAPEQRKRYLIIHVLISQITLWVAQYNKSHHGKQLLTGQQ